MRAVLAGAPAAGGEQTVAGERQFADQGLVRRRRRTARDDLKTAEHVSVGEQRHVGGEVARSADEQRHQAADGGDDAEADGRYRLRRVGQRVDHQDRPARIGFAARVTPDQAAQRPVHQAHRIVVQGAAVHCGKAVGAACGVGEAGPVRHRPVDAVAARLVGDRPHVPGGSCSARLGGTAGARRGPAAWRRWRRRNGPACRCRRSRARHLLGRPRIRPRVCLPGVPRLDRRRSAGRTRRNRRARHRLHHRNRRSQGHPRSGRGCRACWRR